MKKQPKNSQQQKRQKKKSRRKGKGVSVTPRKKPVDEYLTFRAMSSAIGTISCEADDNGLLSSKQATGALTHIREYQRESGKPKVLTKMYFTDGKAHTDLLKAVKSNYQVLACVDTNRVIYKGVELNVTAAFCSDSVLNPDLDELTLNACRFTVFYNVKDGINPEVIGWHVFITDILPALNFSEGEKICMLVDSELDAHEKINAREIPYYSNFFLPENVDLLYASADSAGHAFNKFMKFCDRKCSEVCQKISNNEFAFPEFKESDDKDFDLYAYINLKD